MEFLGLVVRRAVSGEPHVDLAFAPPVAIGNGEHVDVILLGLEDLGQLAAQAGEPGLMTGRAAEEVLYCDV